MVVARRLAPPPKSRKGFFTPQVNFMYSIDCHGLMLPAHCRALSVRSGRQRRAVAVRPRLRWGLARMAAATEALEAALSARRPLLRWPATAAPVRQRALWCESFLLQTVSAILQQICLLLARNVKRSRHGCYKQSLFSVRACRYSEEGKHCSDIGLTASSDWHHQ